MKITVCIITLNEEQNLERCLSSVKAFADEIVVVDNGSTDRTKEIAESFGARFVHHEWAGYTQQKNIALSLAQNEWVFSIDGDEEVSTMLKNTILRLKREEPNVSGFEISRIVYYQGEWVRFGDWYPDYLIRLFRNRDARFMGGDVHERLVVRGEVKRLQGEKYGELYHYTYRNDADQIRRIHKYADLWVKTALKNRKRCNFSSAALHAFWKFIRGYFFKAGWKGGELGWKIAWLTAYEVYLKYNKLYAVQDHPEKILGKKKIK